MRNLSITQEYYLCALKEDGHLPLLKTVEVSTCLVAGEILELLMDGFIRIDEKKKIEISKDLSSDRLYLAPVYKTIQDSKPMKIETLAEKYILGTNKKLENLCDVLGASLTNNNYVIEKPATGLFHNKNLYVPNTEAATKVIEKMRAEFLEAGSVSDETVALGVLFSKSGLIKQYFSKHETSKLNERLDEIKVSETGLFVKKIVDYIDTMVAIIAAV
jgi:hypothetical protein